MRHDAAITIAMLTAENSLDSIAALGLALAHCWREPSSALLWAINGADLVTAAALLAGSPAFRTGMEPNCLLVLRFGGGRPWWTALRSRRFSQPVTVYRMHSDDSGHSKLIVTTREAYDDLMETRAPLANPAWQAALDAIVRALLDPTPKNVEGGA
jgi:hypothetical protein